MTIWGIKDIIVDGLHVKAQAPIIISASRSTDIPAFYMDWFFHRLRLGYSAWINPFNGFKSYISYANTRFIVFWSKDPRPLLNYIPELRALNIKCYVQYSLNDYQDERLEKVPKLEYRIDTFKMLVKELGKGSVIWRFDPLILTDNISIGNLLDKVRKIGDSLIGYTEKLVFSFADIISYKKVKHNLETNGILYQEWTESQMEIFAACLSDMNRERGWNYELATCGEKIDLRRFGITHNRCIDGDLITRLAWDDRVLMDFMGVRIEDLPEPSLFGDRVLPEGAIELPDGYYFISRHRKDSGQRQFCECMASKDIGEYNTCPHLCEYCYANSTKHKALDNWLKHKLNPFSDTITGE